MLVIEKVVTHPYPEYEVRSILNEVLGHIEYRNTQREPKWIFLTAIPVDSDERYYFDGADLRQIEKYMDALCETGFKE